MLMKCLFFISLIFISGCATLRVDKSYTFKPSALDTFKREVVVDQTTVHDIRRIFGEPHIRSINEASSVEIPKVPLLDKFDYIPKETWTYFRPQSDMNLQKEDIFKIFGVGLISKDFQMISIFFNEKGRVLGYVVNNHSIK